MIAKKKKKPAIWYAIRFPDGSTVGQLYTTRKLARWSLDCFWPVGKVVKVNLVEAEELDALHALTAELLDAMQYLIECNIKPSNMHISVNTARHLVRIHGKNKCPAALHD